MRLHSIPLLLLLFTWSYAPAQHISKTYKLHSHNDYLQKVPFWEAYANNMESIEADVILMENELYVAHGKESIKKNRTLASLYLDPIRMAFELNFEGSKDFQLLIDIKTEPISTLEKLMEILNNYQDILGMGPNSPKVNVVVSGNRPPTQAYGSYPSYIQFDYQSVSDTSMLPLGKIALISLNFKHFSAWNGEGEINAQEKEALVKAIGVADSLHKPIRFWATPDTGTAWKVLNELGVDFINTDQPYKAKAYFDNKE